MGPCFARRRRQGEGAGCATRRPVHRAAPCAQPQDLRDVPQSMRATMQFVEIATVDDAMRGVLAEAGARRSAPELDLV